MVREEGLRSTEQGHTIQYSDEENFPQKVIFYPVTRIGHVRSGKGNRGEFQAQGTRI